jgi:uncharacterized protein (DUF58 family)
VGFSLSALGRSRVPGKRPPACAAAVGGAYVTLDDLSALEMTARDFSFLPRQPVHSILTGRQASRVRGRGLAFEELRPYLPGDDIRRMDWRSTARTGKPYVRVYTEEKDRPALVVVDQRINMFFGTRRAMKSVAAAEAAALCAWRILAVGDRVGGLVFNDERLDEVRPARSRAAVTRLLEVVVAQNALLRADSNARRTPSRLNAALEAVARVAEHDHLVVVISDFDGHDERTRDLLLGLSLHNDVIAVLIYDPFLFELPSAGELVVSDGELQVELPFGAGRVRKRLSEAADARLKELLEWRSEIGVPVLPISSAEETASQIRRLLGQLVGRTGGR